MPVGSDPRTEPRLDGGNGNGKRTSTMAPKPPPPNQPLATDRSDSRSWLFWFLVLAAGAVLWYLLVIR